jgi:uncharacterized cysteine cluster protein YcgN (CxxCxxCC family)
MTFNSTVWLDIYWSMDSIVTAVTLINFDAENDTDIRFFDWLAVTISYKLLQSVTNSYNQLQTVTNSYNQFQSVTISYNENNTFKTNRFDLQIHACFKACLLET